MFMATRTRTSELMYHLSAMKRSRPRQQTRIAIAEWLLNPVFIVWGANKANTISCHFKQRLELARRKMEMEEQWQTTIMSCNRALNLKLRVPISYQLLRVLDEVQQPRGKWNRKLTSGMGSLRHSSNQKKHLGVKSTVEVRI